MRESRRGYTLIEILVAAGIVAILIGMLLPAVQASRESARRAMCLANLQQIGNAIHQHESAHQMLPGFWNGAASIPQPRSVIDEFHFHSWRVPLLPFLEQPAVASSLNLGLPATFDENQTAVNVKISVFVCPSSPDGDRAVGEISPWTGSLPPWTGVGTAARADYEAVGGIIGDTMRGNLYYQDNFKASAWGEPTYVISPTRTTDRDRKAKLVDITDGLSNTILVAERAGRPDVYTDGRLDIRFPYPPGRGWDHMQATWAISTHFPWYCFFGPVSVNRTNRSFFSFHFAGSAVALADGSARVLKPSTSPAVLEALITRSGGDVAE